jgi:SAM-dependent methyltransferase
MNIRTSMNTSFGKISRKDTNYKRFKKNKLFYRSRGLKELQERFSENIAQIINNSCIKQKRVNVLEIGFGEGKALSEMGAINSKIFCYGINDKKKESLSNIKDLQRNSQNFGVKPYNTPKIYFYDAGNGLNFKDNYFDIIYSQVAIHYVDDKAKLLEEIWRVLKKGGHAFLHIDNKLQGRQPDFMYQYKDTPRFIIYDKKKIISTSSYFKKIEKKGFDIRLNIRNDKKDNINIIIHKNTEKMFNLGLGYDGNSSINLTKLKNTDAYKFDSAIWRGTRSVFIVK